MLTNQKLDDRTEAVPYPAQATPARHTVRERVAVPVRQKIGTGRSTRERIEAWVKIGRRLL